VWSRKNVLPSSMKIDVSGTSTKEEPWINSTFRGITIDRIFEYENDFDSIRFNDDGDSNEIDESE
jgi:hypothetical protein